ncbi:MAG: SH3 domain-containing protein [Candidatus Aminicenantes bacterium]|nr:SH3 domain-containing protein [Candidatus Aminicenantes bacterium]
MKKKIFLLIFLAMVAFLLAGKSLFVQVLRSQLLAKPDFLSRSLASLSKGARLELIETQGSWYLVKNSNGLKGYVHRSAVIKSKSTLSGAIPYKKGASDQELALAAKGFNEGNEKKLRGGREYDFAAVDWVLDQGVPPAAVAAFVREGKLK